VTRTAGVVRRHSVRRSAKRDAALRQGGYTLQEMKPTGRAGSVFGEAMCFDQEGCRGAGGSSAPRELPAAPHLAWSKAAATRKCCGKRCARASHGIHSFLQGAGCV